MVYLAGFLRLNSIVAWRNRLRPQRFAFDRQVVLISAEMFRSVILPRAYERHVVESCGTSTFTPLGSHCTTRNVTKNIAVVRTINAASCQLYVPHETYTGIGCEQEEVLSSDFNAKVAFSTSVLFMCSNSLILLSGTSSGTSGHSI